MRAAQLSVEAYWDLCGQSVEVCSLRAGPMLQLRDEKACGYSR